MASERPYGVTRLLTDSIPPVSESQLARFTRENLKIGEVVAFSPKQAVAELGSKRDWPNVYAIDLGGDKISGGLWGMENGVLRPRGEGTTLSSRDGAGYLAFMEDVAFGNSVEIPVGLSIAGPLIGTTLDHAPNMSVLEAELGDKYDRDFAKIFPNRRTAVQNDAFSGLKASAVAVARQFGEERTVLYLINGSGLGGALYKDGQLIAMEPGHIEADADLNPFDRSFSCGMDNRGWVCLESLSASRAGIEQMWKEETGQDWDGMRISQHYQDGDAYSRLMYDNSAAIMGHVVAGIGRAFRFSEEDWARTVVVLHGGTGRVPGYSERFGQYMRAYTGHAELPLLLTTDFSVNACQEGAGIGALIN